MFKRWEAYWFSPAPLFNLAICRIILVSCQLYFLAARYESFIDAASLPAFLYDPLPALELFIWPFEAGFRPSQGILIATFWVTTGAGIAALIGWITRSSLWVFALGNIFLQAHAYSYGDIHHPEALMMISLVVLAMSPAGKVLSVDDWWRKGRPKTKKLRNYLAAIYEKKSTFACWPLLLIQVMLAFVYFDAGISKMHESGMDWLNGYTLQYYMAQDAMRWGSDLGFWISQHHTLAHIMSWGAVIFELTFFVVLFFPRLAVFYIVMGTAMHTGIYLTMKAPFFQFVALYAVFVPWTDFLKATRERWKMKFDVSGKKAHIKA